MPPRKKGKGATSRDAQRSAPASFADVRRCCLSGKPPPLGLKSILLVALAAWGEKHRWRGRSNLKTKPRTFFTPESGQDTIRVSSPLIMFGGVRTVASRFAAGLLRRGVGAAGSNGISTSAIAASASAAAAEGGGRNVVRRLDDHTTTAAKEGVESTAVRLLGSSFSFERGALPDAVVPVRRHTLADAITAVTAVTADDADAGASRRVEASRWNRRIPRWSGGRRPRSITVRELLAQLRCNLRFEASLWPANNHYGGGGEGEDVGAELRSFEEFFNTPVGGPITYDASSTKIKRVRARFICFQRNAPEGRRGVVHREKNPKNKKNKKNHAPRTDLSTSLSLSSLHRYSFAEIEDEQAQTSQAEKEGQEQEQVERLERNVFLWEKKGNSFQNRFGEWQRCGGGLLFLLFSPSPRARPHRRNAHFSH